MATSSSEESNSAPTDFNISSLTGSNNGKASFIYEKCPLCVRCRKTFYCRDCVANGDITHSKATYPERFAEKKLKLFRLTKEKAKYLENCQELFERKRRLDSIQTEAHQYSQRNKLLRLAIQSTAVKVEKERQELTKLQEKIEYYIERKKVHVNKVQKIQRYTIRCQREMQDNREKLESTQEELATVIREHIQQLSSFIFPITEVIVNHSAVTELVESAVTELAEAQQTNYIKGHWVLTNNSNELQYRIVEPCLPSNGDYSAYPIWVTEHKDTMPATVVDGEQRNPAYDIIAALTHTAQLISVLEYFLDIRLPKTLSFSEFCGHELTEQQFKNKVAKLNANVLYLCLSQNVNPRLLHAHQTIPNLLVLLNPEHSDLGRCGPIEVNPSLIESMEDSLAKDLNFVDEVYDEKNSDEEELNGDWETVPSLQTSDIPSVPSTISYAGQAGAYSQVQPPNTATSLADGLFSVAASSVASLWRAATGHNK